MPKKLKYKYHKDGTLPEDLTEYIFVFGSNLGGLHGLGAAVVAKNTFGAEHGVGKGRTGFSYAIATKDRFIRTLHIREIAEHVEAFKKYTHDNPDLKFWVTRVGCGLARFKDKDVAVHFYDCNVNCSFPEQWRPFVEK